MKFFSKSFKLARYHWPLYLFVLPSMALVILFQYYPAASGIYHSFFRWNGADVADFLGFDNFTELLNNREFWVSFKVALLLGLWNVLKMIPALLVAVCIHRCRSDKFQFAYRALFVAPMVIPGLVTVLIWRSFFFEATGGFLNRFLHSTGLMNLFIWLDQTFHWGGAFGEGRSPAWLGDPKLILASCVVWGFPWVGSFAVLTYLAKLQSIGREVYEAAEIDGIGWFSKFTRIELPLIMSSVYLLLVFVIIDTIKDAGMVLALAGMEGGPGGTVTVPALFMIRKAFIDQQMGFACAIGIVLTLVVIAAQKLSVWLLDWGNVPRWGKIAIRTGAIFAGGFMLYKGVLFVLAIIVLAMALDLGGRWKQFREWLRDRISERRAVASARVAPMTTPHTRRARVRELVLRAGKHAFIWLVLFVAYIPLYLMLVVSLKDNQQFYLSPAAPNAPYHWDNWSLAWRTILPSLANSLFVSTMSTLFTLALAVGAAYFFARKKMPMSGVLWNGLLVLMMMPTIANLIPLFRLLNDLSLVNTLTALILVSAAGGQAFAIFVLRTFIQDIPQDLFEAAEVDGASHLAQIRHIVLPMAAPILGTIGVMHFISQWNDFVLPLIIIRDQARLPVMVQLLRMAGEYIKLWGPLMAGYTLASIPIIILFILCMRLFTRGLTEGAVKG